MRSFEVYVCLMITFVCAVANLPVFSAIKWCRCDGGHSQGHSDTFSTAPSPNNSTIIIHLGAADGLLLMELVDRQPAPALRFTRQISPSAAPFFCFFFLTLCVTLLPASPSRSPFLSLSLSRSLLFKMVKAWGDVSKLLICCRILCADKRKMKPEAGTLHWKMFAAPNYFSVSALLKCSTPAMWLCFTKDI